MVDRSPPRRGQVFLVDLDPRCILRGRSARRIPQGFQTTLCGLDLLNQLVVFHGPSRIGKRDGNPEGPLPECGRRPERDRTLRGMAGIRDE